LEKRVERLVFSRADLILADRLYYRDYALMNGGRRERAHATRVLADGAYETARSSSGARVVERGPQLVYVGRLDEDKLALEMAQAMVRVRQRYGEATLVCAGFGALEAEMVRVSDGAVHPIGSQPLETLPDLVASADAVLAAHLGYTLIEAGLTGVPIATYDYDYFGEILDNGRSGYLAPLHDTEALARDACELIADPGLAAQMGARTRRRLLSEHSLEAVTPMYQRAYDQVLAPGL
jgi:glycosyltransferase involved in cell wall biosynthesis